MFETAPELLKDDHVLTVICIKRVFIIGHPVNRIIAVCFHDASGLSGAGGAENVRHFQFPPLRGVGNVTEHGAQTLYLIQVLVGHGDGVHDIGVACAVLDQSLSTRSAVQGLRRTKKTWVWRVSHSSPISSHPGFSAKNACIP